MRFGMLTTNPIIDCALLAWFLAQLAKVILEAVLLRKLDLRLFVSSGGMPSSHSALVVSATVAIGKHCGFSGPAFALAVVLSAVVMYDACNVRRSAGDTARLEADGGGLRRRPPGGHGAYAAAGAHGSPAGAWRGAAGVGGRGLNVLLRGN